MTDTALNVQIRWLIRKDMPDVLHIENACFTQCWSEHDFLTVLRQRNCIGMVVDHGHEIAGFYIYELQKQRLRILNLAVAPKYQRRSVGSQMVQRLVDKLSLQRRQEIQVEVRESNLIAQKFFASQGFRAVSVLREFYQDTEEDAYLFKFLASGSELRD